MASASKTPNLNLPQWVGTEKPERTDFNEAFDAIDTTVASHLAGSANKHMAGSGHNTNGYYIRFDDGTQIAYRKSIHNLNSDVAQIHPFPAIFTEVFTTTVSFDSTTQTGYLMQRAAFSTLCAFNSPMTAWATRTRENLVEHSSDIFLFAIGRWK